MKKIVRRILKYGIFSPVLLSISPLLILMTWAFDDNKTFMASTREVFHDIIKEDL